MGTARILLASAAAIGMLASAAVAEDMNGLITKIDRLNSTISIQQVQGGTVGANGGGATGPVQEFKAKDAGMLESVHAGDRVSFSTADTNGTKTITKLQKAK
jgi:Cu/Ag efflux protein CusF